jgi:hypothetical protein
MTPFTSVPSTGHRVQTAALLGLALWAGVAAASDIDYVNQFRNVAFRQTADTTVVDNGAFFSASIVAAAGAVGVYSDGVMSFGDPDSPSLTGLSSNDGGASFSFQTPTLASQALMDATYPVSTAYSFALNPGGPVATLVAGAAAYPLSAPQLTGSSFSALQGMNAAAPVTLTFSPFGVAPGATEALVFFSIYDQTTATWVYPVSFGAPSTNGVTLGANLLAAGHSFTFELIYSDRVQSVGDGANFAPQLGFDFRTDGDFSTAAAVPEPATWALMLGGVLALGLRHRRSRLRLLHGGR